jgi:hypothetical protein
MSNSLAHSKIMKRVRIDEETDDDAFLHDGTRRMCVKRYSRRRRSLVREIPDSRRGILKDLIVIEGGKQSSSLEEGY